jgi:hypothetical protein
VFLPAILDANAHDRCLMSRGRLFDISLDAGPSAVWELDLPLCTRLREIAMEGAILAIHFIPSFVVFALALGRPFRLDKAVPHKAPFPSAAADIVSG